MSNDQQFYDFSDNMFDTQRIKFHKFEGNKNGSPFEHKFRVLPPYAPNKLFHKIGLHWGFKSVDGNNKSLVCLLETKGTCPICDEINKKKGEIENIDSMLKSCVDLGERKKLEEKKEELDAYVGDHRRKPMYLWNILTENGEHKVLQLSWNGHDPLHEKIKFWWDKKKINITHPKNNYLMYCQRSGIKAKTRYVYEVLEGCEKEIELPNLIKLDEVYTCKSIDFLKEVLETGIVPSDQEDPNDRNFETSNNSESHTQQESQQNETKVSNESASNGTTELETKQSVEKERVQEKESTQDQGSGVQLSQQQDDEVAQMMAALQS